MIVAVTPENELLLVEEYRYPLHARTIGLPAGIAGDDHEETLKEAAYRELIEETGYQPATLRLLCSGPSSPGLTSEIIHFFMAGALVQVSEGGGVDNENITVHRAPLDTIDQWIESQLRQGRVIDPRVYLALRFLHA